MTYYHKTTSPAKVKTWEKEENTISINHANIIYQFKYYSQGKYDCFFNIFVKLLFISVYENFIYQTIVLWNGNFTYLLAFLLKIEYNVYEREISHNKNG